MTRPLGEADLETMRDLTGPDGPIAARWCRTCDKHYRFCTCEKPDWCTRADGKLSPLPGEPGGPQRLSDLL